MGLLISVEGGEFVGKTSFIESLYKQLISSGINVQTFRDPGGTTEGEKIRNQIFDKKSLAVNPQEIAELFFESRSHLIKEILIPQLGKSREKHVLVILDRYIDSTRVYQGFEAGMDLEIIRELEKRYIDNFYPDLTIILYLPEVSFEKILNERIEKTVGKKNFTRWDKSSTQIQLKRQKFFLQIPELSKKWREKRQFLLLDSSQDMETLVKVAKKKILELQI